MKLLIVLATIVTLLLLEQRVPYFSFQNSWRSRIVSNLELGLFNSIASSFFLLWLLWVGNYVTSQFSLELPHLAPIQTLPPLMATILGLLALDLYMYLWHRAMHTVPLAWQFHRVHHTDRTMNVSTAYRFHPIEVLASSLPKLLLIWLLGISTNIVLTYELIFTVVVGLQHSNVAIPPAIDRWLAHVIVTPNYHRLHHSQIVAETQSNYGSVLTWWDRIWQTQTPEAAHEIELGVSDEHRDLNIWQLLKLPLTTSSPNPTIDL